MLHPCARGDVAIPRATRLCAESITRGRGGAGHKGSSWEKVGKMLGICTHFMQGTPYIYVSSRTRGAARPVRRGDGLREAWSCADGFVPGASYSQTPSLVRAILGRVNGELGEPG